MSINSLLNDNDLKILVMEFLNFKRGKVSLKYRNINKQKLNRKLSYWMIGYIKKQIDQKAKDNGVILTKVNPRNTSITCSVCGNINKENRNFKHFKCLKCGFECDADLNASYIIMNRLSTDQPRLQKLKEIFFGQSESKMSKLNWICKNV